MPHEIRFSHSYNKQPADYELSVLLDVIRVRLEDLSEAFKIYDTTIKDSTERYPLPERGEYMMLLLLSPSNQLWTTLRRRTPDKEMYY